MDGDLSRDKEIPEQAERRNSREKNRDLGKEVTRQLKWERALKIGAREERWNARWEKIEMGLYFAVRYWYLPIRVAKMKTVNAQFRLRHQLDRSHIANGTVQW